MSRLVAASILLASFISCSATEARSDSTTSHHIFTHQPAAAEGPSSLPASKSRTRMKFIEFESLAFDRSFTDNSRIQGVPGHAGLGRSIGGQEGISSQAYGNGGTQWAYTTSRVASSSDQPNNLLINSPVSAQPYRSTGKLYARWGSVWYVCTAALVKKSILLTAAHCVHDYGKGDAGFANEVIWVPANTTSKGGDFGAYTALDVRIPAPYYSGTDTCAVTGVVCNNDIATIVLNLRNGAHAGVALGGWYSYGWNGYSYVANSAFGKAAIADITQLGYPVAFDGGFQMQRNNSFGKFVVQTAKKKKLLNTLLGSALTGGSSGGPWFVNFGTAPEINGEASFGNASERNVIVGVTSWGYSTVGINIQGASWFGQNNEFPAASYGAFGAGNIGKLMYDTCLSYAGYC